MNRENQPITSLIDPLSNIYVETGTHTCISLDSVLALPQFKAFYSIELSDEWFNFAKNRYRNTPKVKIVHGDSGKALADVLSEIDDKYPDARCIIFLDSHYSGAGTAKGSVCSPIKSELNALLWYRHLIQQVIADDIQASCDLSTGNRIFEQDEAYYEGWLSIESIIAKLCEINPKFEIKLNMKLRVWGCLVASLPSKT